jgi:DNA mismatch endonuclease, patch repair protein
MGDWLTPEQRRRNMAAIHSRGTNPEARLLSALRGVFPGRRIRLHAPLPGRPDCYLPALRLAVFADGCYWHGCPEHHRMPEDNRDYWTQKLKRNRRRDREVVAALRAEGYTVIRVWEHDLKTPASRLGARLRRAGTISLGRRAARDRAARRAARARSDPLTTSV